MRRGRRVRRVVRRIDLWSVLKVSLLFCLSVAIVLLTGAVILWSVAQSSGAVHKIEKFMDGLGFTNFRFNGQQIFKFALFAGLVLVIAGTIFAVILAFLYNLISDLVGGIQVQVIEEEQVVSGMEPPQRRRGRAAGKPPKPGRVKGGRGGPPVPQEPPLQRRTVV